MAIKQLLSIILLVNCCYASAQGLLRYPVHTYSVDDGLSQSSVYHILQDSRHYVWVGTGDGLNKLSPDHIDIFKHYLNDTTSISANSIRGLLEDEQGNIWIGTDKGLNVYNHDKNTISRSYKGNQLYSDLTAIPIAVYESKIYFLIQTKGFFAIDLKSGKREMVLKTGEIFRSDKRCLIIKDSRIMAATFKGDILAINLKSNSTERIILPDSTEIVTQLGPFINNELLVAQGSVLYQFNENKRSWKEFYRGTANIHSFALIGEEELWLTEWGRGILRFRRDGILLEPPRSNIHWKGKEPIDVSMVNYLYEDKNGLIWVGVEGLGIVNIDPEPRFGLISRNDPYFPGLENHFIRSFEVLDDSRFLAGTYRGGVYKIDLNNRQVTGLKFSRDIGSIINAIAAGSDDTFFISTESGVWQAILAGTDYTVIKTLSPPANSLIILENNVLIASETGLYMMNSASLQVELVMAGNFKFLLKTATGFLALSHSGIYRGNLSGEITSAGGKELTDYRLKSLCENKGNLWAASENGILKLDYKTFELKKHLTEKNGLPDNFTYGLLYDGKTLWGSTNRGLFKYNPENGVITTYKVQDGLQSNEFNSGCFKMMPGGTMLFGGISGINYFPLKEYKEIQRNTPLYLKGLWLNDEPAQPELLARGLKSNEKNIVLEWDLMNWSNKGKKTIACKLEGFDTAWVLLNGKNTIRYTSLPAGQYKLWAQVINEEGENEKEVLHSAFHIAQPLYKRNWFIFSSILICALLVTGTVYFTLNLRYRKQLAVLERQKEMDKLRNRISRDIHDDVGSDLSKIRMFSRQLSKERTLEESAYEKLVALSERAINGLTEVVWTVNSTYDRLSDLVAWFRSYAYEYFEHSQIEVDFKVTGGNYSILVDPDIRRSLLMIYKEALNNVLKHSGATKVSISWKGDARGNVEMCIEDNGCGMDPARKKNGNGLNNMQLRAEQAGLSLSFYKPDMKGAGICLKGKLFHKNTTKG